MGHMASVTRRLRRNQHAAEFGVRGVANAEIADGLLRSLGDVQKAAEHAKVSRATVYRKLAGSRELRVLKKQLDVGVAAGLSKEQAREHAIDAVKELLK